MKDWATSLVSATPPPTTTPLTHPAHTTWHETLLIFRFHLDSIKVWDVWCIAHASAATQWRQQRDQYRLTSMVAITQTGHPGGHWRRRCVWRGRYSTVNLGLFIARPHLYVYGGRRHPLSGTRNYVFYGLVLQVFFLYLSLLPFYWCMCLTYDDCLQGTDKNVHFYIRRKNIMYCLLEEQIKGCEQYM